MSGQKILARARSERTVARMAGPTPKNHPAMPIATRKRGECCENNGVRNASKPAASPTRMKGAAQRITVDGLRFMEKLYSCRVSDCFSCNPLCVRFPPDDLADEAFNLCMSRLLFPVNERLLWQCEYQSEMQAVNDWILTVGAVYDRAHFLHSKETRGHRPRPQCQSGT